MKDKMLFYTHAYQMIYTWISIYTCVCKDINIYVYTYIYKRKENQFNHFIWSQRCTETFQIEALTIYLNSKKTFLSWKKIHIGWLKAISVSAIIKSDPDSESNFELKRYRNKVYVSLKSEKRDCIKQWISMASDFSAIIHVRNQWKPNVHNLEKRLQLSHSVIISFLFIRRWSSLPTLFSSSLSAWLFS